MIISIISYFIHVTYICILSYIYMYIYVYIYMYTDTHPLVCALSHRP